MSENTPILQIKNLTHIYSAGTPFEHKALDNVNLTVERGEFVALIGHTGSGKSTLIQHLNGLLRPTRGSVLFDGQDIFESKSRLRTVRFHVGLLFQYPEYQLFGETVEEDVAFGPGNMGLDNFEINRRVENALRLVGLPADVASRSPFDLSGGQKRRVAIAGVLAMEPDVLILDEPTAGMDALSRRQMWNLLRKLNGKNLTILLTTHYMEEAQNLCSRVALMDHGKLEEVNTPAGLIDSLGNYTVDEFAGDETHSHYFHSREEAIAYLSGLSGQASLRETTLEDVFVERAGRHLMPS